MLHAAYYGSFYPHNMLVKDLVDEDELISQLRSFGLTEMDAKVYTGLLKLGPSKVRQISNFADIHRIKGYRILENLKNFGFVSATFSNPTIYSANDLKTSLQNVTSRKKFELERLEKLAPLLSASYEKLKLDVSPQADVEQAQQAQFNMISGRSNIHSQIEKLIKKEKKDLYLVTTSADLGMMYYTSIPEAIQEAQNRGAVIKCVTEMEGKKANQLINRMKIDNSRITNLPSQGRIVCGDSETLVSGYTDDKSGRNSDQDSALFTNSNEFVRNMKCLCSQLWKSGKDLHLIKKKGVGR